MEVRKGLIAHHYAKALMLFQGSREDVTQRLHGLTQIKTLLETTPHLLDFFSLPQVAIEEKIKVIDLCLRSEDRDPLLSAFMLYLIERMRLDYLPEIVQNYRELMNREYGILEATVISSYPFKEELKERLRKKIENFYAQEVHLKEEIDPSCIGGFKLLVANHMFDGTIRGQLDRLKRELRN
jgi:F-type H+-transporting ATPase subunit delta